MLTRISANYHLLRFSNYPALHAIVWAVAAAFRPEL
jgi:hypothetical protein